jgi:hypothetical protein
MSVSFIDRYSGLTNYLTVNTISYKSTVDDFNHTGMGKEHPFGTLPFYLDLTSWYAGNFSFWLIKIEDYTMNYSMSISLILRGSVPLFPSASQHLSISASSIFEFALEFCARLMPALIAAQLTPLIFNNSWFIVSYFYFSSTVLFECLLLSTHKIQVQIQILKMLRC